jgi:hypothetical protein
VCRLAPDGLDAWKQVVERGYEGYVAKDEASPYEGEATRRWLKVKVPGWTDRKQLAAWNPIGLLTPKPGKGIQARRGPADLGQSAGPDGRQSLLGDDLVLDLVVGRLRHHLLLYKIVLGLIGPVLDDLLGVGLADALQRLQLVG